MKGGGWEHQLYRCSRRKSQRWIQGPEAHGLRLAGSGAGVAAPVGERGPRKKSLGTTVLWSRVRTFLRDETGRPAPGVS